ncbi:MAG: hypothetical protein ACK5L3_08625 [Oscillospiraceae bacterium]
MLTIFTMLRVWLQYITVKGSLKVARIQGYEKLLTGALWPAVKKKLWADGYEEYTQGGYLSVKRYFWTTAPQKPADGKGAGAQQ